MRGKQHDSDSGGSSKEPAVWKTEECGLLGQLTFVHSGCAVCQELLCSLNIQ